GDREDAMSEPVGLARGLTNYGDPDFALYLRRSFARSMGYSTELLARPVIGIADTHSGFSSCHRHFPELLEAVKRGVMARGGLADADRPLAWRAARRLHRLPPLLGEIPCRRNRRRGGP